MNYEQKLHALNALGECKVLMREPGNWYVSQSVEVKDGGVLVGEYGNGSTPKQAIENHWDVLASLDGGRYIVINAYGDNRKAVKWNGFMWAEVREN